MGVEREVEVKVEMDVEVVIRMEEVFDIREGEEGGRNRGGGGKAGWI